jgi:hypothetical protein
MVVGAASVIRPPKVLTPLLFDKAPWPPTPVPLSVRASGPVASATELTVRYGPHTVLDRAAMAIEEGERIGLVDETLSLRAYLRREHQSFMDDSFA